MRYKLTVAYDGTAYHGWQVQREEPTVQGVLEAAVRRWSGEAVRVAASGRTDAGVHASGQVVSFALERAWPLDTVLRALNALTPVDLTVTGAEVVADDFDPRRSARRRCYEYRIWNARWPSPFWRRYAWHVPRPLDHVAMHAAAQVLLGEHDFTSFRAAGCDAETPVRRVFRSEWSGEAPLLGYAIEATAFLRHMVRNIVGTLVEVGLGERRPDDVAAVLAARDRTLAAATAPPRGLCLTRVSY